MMAIKLREAMLAFRRRTGTRITYVGLSEKTGIAQTTLRAIGSKLHYNTTVDTLEKLCRALGVGPGELLELVDDPPKAKHANRKKRSS